jgi:proton-translocating NADH-quinone oxidoreductase chain M
LFFLDLQPQSGPQGTWLLMEEYPWIAGFGAKYSLGLDGISLVLVMLTAFINVFCVLISWEAIKEKVGPFFFFLLFLEGALIGLFLANDLLLFYLFWEIQLIPMFFLVGIWGHKNRIHAAVKFILYTVTGSLLMLIALIALHIMHWQQTGVATFNPYQLMHTRLSFTTEVLLFLAFLLAFGIKIPLIPVHTWLPDTHTEAPTAGSVDLAGLLLKPVQVCHPPLSPRLPALWPAAPVPGSRGAVLCRLGGSDPNRHQAAGGLLQHLPHGHDSHRHRHLEPHLPERLNSANGQPRHLHLGSLHHGGHAG